MMNQRILLHIGFWLTLLVLQTYITADLTSSYRDFSWTFRIGKAASEAIGVVLLQAAIFYWLFYRLIPQFQKGLNFSAVFELILGVSISVLSYRLLLGYIIYPFVYGDNYDGQLFSISKVLFSFIKVYSIVGLAGAIKLFRTRQRQRDREQQLIREKLESELHFLRAQVNPHFFFNTLNNIYGLARKQSDQTADAVMRLSKLMRFILYECSGNQIAIAKEIKILEDYIELEKLRYNDRLEVLFEKKIDNENQQIAPLLLLPFVENSFKHGASESRFQSKIDIQLEIKNQNLTFSIKNSKEPDHQKNTEGLGLQNVKRQLELVYPENYTLEIDDQEKSFSVLLKINLASHESN